MPWVTTPPDLIEQIVAVLLSRRHPEALRIRASQGDGGLDVLVPAATPGYVDNYQVKKFATSLGDSQKQQIRESLKAARDTHNDQANPFLIQTWLLTLPMNPKPGGGQVAGRRGSAAAGAVQSRVAGLAIPGGTSHPLPGGHRLLPARWPRSATGHDRRPSRPCEPVSATGAAVEPGDLTARQAVLDGPADQAAADA